MPSSRGSSQPRNPPRVSFIAGGFFTSWATKALFLKTIGSDHELLIDKFRLKMNKVGKTTRPFRYDLNQIPYDYSVEVRNRFKGLDLINRMPDIYQNKDRGSWHCTGDRDQDHPQGKEMQKSKMALWGGLTNSCEKKRSEKQRSKWKIYPSECRVLARRDLKKSLPQWSVQRNRGKQENGKD